MVQGPSREGLNRLLERDGEGWQCTPRRGLGSLWQLMGNMGQSKTLHLAILIFHGVEPWDTTHGAPRRQLSISISISNLPSLVDSP